MSAQGTEFTEAIKELREVAELMYNSAGNKNTQTINVNAGGWGVLIALIMVAFLAGLNIAQSAKQVVTATEIAKQTSEINEIRRKQDREVDYVMSIFRMVPEIKQKIDADKEKEKDHFDRNHNQPQSKAAG